MKNKFKIIVRRAALALAVCGSAFCVPHSALGQVTSPTLFIATNMPATLSSNVVNNLTNSAGQSQIFYLTKDCDLAIAGRLVSTLQGGNTTLSGSFSLDTTNFGCYPFSLVASNYSGVPTNNYGFPTNSFWTNFNHSVIAAFAAMKLDQVTNSGAGVVTNLGTILSRPTINTATY